MPAMSEYDWKHLHLLNRTDHQWGEYGKIERAVIIELDRFLFDHHLLAKVTCGTQGAHVVDSYHFPSASRLGCALDFMLVDLKPRELPDVFINLCRYGFHGIGIYSEWKLNQNGPRMGGFHVDYRPQETKALWLKGWGGSYEAVTLANFQKYFL